MRLQLKFAIYNALIKGAFLGIFVIALPYMIDKIVFTHIDSRLKVHHEKVMRVIARGGLQQIIEEDCSYDDYNILKEEFVKITGISDSTMVLNGEKFLNETWTIDNDDLPYRVIHSEFRYDNSLYELNIGEGIEGVLQLKNLLIKFTFWLTVFFLITSFFIDLGFVQGLLRPFYITMRKLKGASDPLKYEAHPINSTTYEFKLLDHTFEQLMIDIQNAINIEKEFIGNVSHELLTPISILQNRFENIIAEGKTDNETAQKIFESQRTLFRLSKIIKSLLMISKIENAQYLKNETCILKELITDVSEELEDRIEQKNIILTTQFDYALSIENCNKTLLHVMLFNILNNAIKYNVDGGSIHIHLTQTFLEIKDTGTGIDEDKLPFIFDRFKRMHLNEGNSYGLGLSIVKTIAHFHNFEIKVTSQPNVGTSFILNFNKI
jgi:signal transduction histidine kinase